MKPWLWGEWHEVLLQKREKAEWLAGRENMILSLFLLFTGIIMGFGIFAVNQMEILTCKYEYQENLLYYISSILNILVSVLIFLSFAGISYGIKIYS